MVKGVGVDIVDIERFKKALDKRERLAGRLFTRRERDYCLATKNPKRHLAARFAAKEAVSKAMGSGRRGFSWRDIEIHRDGAGRPYVELAGGAAETAAARGIEKIDISLSFNHQSAVAAAVAVGNVNEEDKEFQPT